MKKKIYSKDGMKQIINSGWKLFDDQTNFISTGNVLANTQHSSFIRPYKECDCNGFVFKEGELLKSDMNLFGERIPDYIKEILLDKKREDSVILYMFYVWNRDRRAEPFCCVVTDRNYNLIRYSLVLGYKKNYLKRYQAAHEAMSYITN